MQVLPRMRGVYPGVRVDLRLARLRAFKVYVSGQVLRPGVALANGATRASEILSGNFALAENASRRNIELRHPDGRTERVDLDAFAYLGRTEGNPELLDGDVVYVPPRKERVFAFGAFGRPGDYELAPNDDVADLVALAGGLLPGTEPTGMLYHFVTSTEIDSAVVSLAAGRDGERRLENGDRLFARENSDFRRPRNITLVGEVTYPGVYAIREGKDRVSDVLARAGGLTPASARERLQVFRPLVTNGTRRDIEFERLSRLSRSEMTDGEYNTFRTKLAAQEAAYVLSAEDVAAPDNPHNVLLRDGDILLIDRESHAVRVDGQVLRPSLIEYQPGRSIEQYIRLAGGFGQRAWRGKIRVTRAGSNQTLFVRDVREVQPGDFIWVPEKNDVSFWSVFKDVITVAGAAATVILVVRNK
jgi:protein involved in polysaccharide export with SLBB domain